MPRFDGASPFFYSYISMSHREGVSPPCAVFNPEKESVLRDNDPAANLHGRKFPFIFIRCSVLVLRRVPEQDVSASLPAVLDALAAYSLYRVRACVAFSGQDLHRHVHPHRQPEQQPANMVLIRSSGEKPTAVTVRKSWNSSSLQDTLKLFLKLFPSKKASESTRGFALHKISLKITGKIKPAVRFQALYNRTCFRGVPNQVEEKERKRKKNG